MRKQLTLLFAFVIAAAAFAAAANTTAPKSTLDNLQAAFNGESNAHARYVEFAKEADKEGYAQVASLFRAAARAEEIHANNHATIIKKMGGTPSVKIDKIEVKSTKDNLQAAIQGETYERDNMYPEFLKEARASGKRDAVETFNMAKTAEAEHAKLYTEALNNLPKMRVKGVTYYVCTVCGYTTTKLDSNKCPSCFSPKDKYVMAG
jgi:rubrerythrin